jgi:argininosuccinate lyase
MHQDNVMKSEVSGLLSDSLDPLIQELIYGASLEEDFRDVFESMTDVNLAHVVMLSEQGIVEVDTARQLLIALEEMRAAGPSAFNLDPSREETYFNYEANMLLVQRSAALCMWPEAGTTSR